MSWARSFRSGGCSLRCGRAGCLPMVRFHPTTSSVDAGCRRRPVGWAVVLINRANTSLLSGETVWAIGAGSSEAGTQPTSATAVKPCSLGQLGTGHRFLLCGVAEEGVGGSTRVAVVTRNRRGLRSYQVCCAGRSWGNSDGTTGAQLAQWAQSDPPASWDHWVRQAVALAAAPSGGITSGTRFGSG